MPDPKKLSPDDAGLLRTRFDACVEAETKWRAQALKDLKFRAGQQWDDATKTERTKYAQPMFTVNRMDAFIKQITNQYRLSGPTIHVAPAGEDGDEDTAEVFDGIIRHILSISDGEIAIDTAFESAATHGKGYIYVTVDYLDEESNQQEILVKRVRNPFTIYIDPAASEPDCSDMRYAFVTDVMPLEEYKALYGDEVSSADMSGIGDAQKSTWYPQGGVRVVEFFEAVTFKTTRKGRTRVKHIRWRKLNGVGTVLAETTFPITRIPIVPMFGDEFDIDGELDYRGMVRNGVDPQRILNWTFTYLIMQLSVAPQSPFIVSATQLENFEEIWKLANRRTFPYLPYNDKDADGRPTGQPPIRNSTEPPIQATVMALSVAENQYRAVMQLQDASLGKGKADQSGKAVIALQQQGEIGNSNYSDNAKRCLRSLGRLLVMMIPKYMDAPRVLRILGRDEQPKRVMVHANKESQLPSPEDMPQGVDKIYNLGVGRYDVVVTTGPNFVNKQQEQLATLLDLTKADPQIMPVVADLIAKKTGADDVVERLRMIEPLKSLLQKPGDPAQAMQQAQAQLQAFKQQHDLLTKQVEGLTHAIETDQVKAASSERIKSQEIASKERIAVIQSETQQAINAAKLGATADQTQLKAKLDAIEMLLTHTHEASQADEDRAHEAEMGAQDHINTLEQGQQAAALAPPPKDDEGSGGAAPAAVAAS